MLSVGDAIKKAREARGWTLVELSYELRMDKGYLSKLESGAVANPSVWQVHRIAQVFGHTISEFLEEAPAHSPEVLPAPSSEPLDFIEEAAYNAGLETADRLLTEADKEFLAHLSEIRRIYLERVQSGQEPER
jgi:transcriptional regulator with XRE-family HTH domain